MKVDFLSLVDICSNLYTQPYNDFRDHHLKLKDDRIPFNNRDINIFQLIKVDTQIIMNSNNLPIRLCVMVDSEWYVWMDKLEDEYYILFIEYFPEDIYQTRSYVFLIDQDDELLSFVEVLNSAFG